MAVALAGILSIGYHFRAHVRRAKKANAGNISWAHFSDIVRNTLLAKYGGLWVDATVWVRGKIPFDQLSQLDVFSANGEIINATRPVKFWTSYEYNWSTWCMWSKGTNNRVFAFVSEMLIAIAEREKQWPDYVIQDYLMFYAYKNISGVKEMLEQSRTIVCNKRNELAQIMNEAYDENKYRELTKDDFVFKLSYRAKWLEVTKNGKETYYGRILRDII